jgi:hypothetical protein
MSFNVNFCVYIDICTQSRLYKNTRNKTVRLLLDKTVSIVKSSDV